VSGVAVFPAGLEISPPRSGVRCVLPREVIRARIESVESAGHSAARSGREAPLLIKRGSPVIGSCAPTFRCLCLMA
jgi:hypothetical protein